MIIEKAKLSKDILSDKVILITGAGGGVGFEAARAFAYLGASVVIAEIGNEKGVWAQNAINSETNSERVVFFRTDIAEETQIDDLFSFITTKYGHLDVIINNATITPMGAVDIVSISDWDRSYAVNLKAPVVLVQKFLPGMKERNNGVIVFVSSSGAAPYMGAYEVFKTAQVELCNTLSSELEGTDIFTYTIAPGLVKTETAQRAIETVSSLMGMTISEFYAMNKHHIISAEEAGAGYVLSVVNAEQYNGQEISSIQALMDAGVFADEIENEKTNIVISDTERASQLIGSIVHFFVEQYDGWHKRNVFEKQWVMRDFKKTVGVSADSFHKLMLSVLELIPKKEFDKIAEYKPHFDKLQKYHIHQNELLQGYEKNPAKLKEYSQILEDRIKEVQLLLDMLV